MANGLDSQAARRIPVAGPSISEIEIEYILDAARNGWYEHATDYVKRFQSAFAEQHGVEFALALPSCTSAIHLALASAGINANDEVIVPEVTWIASAAPVAYVGARPVFADVDSSNWCITPEAIESCISNKTRAVIVVDLYGDLPDMQAIRDLADRHQLLLIEDAAQAIGSRLNGRRAGTWGDVGVFSFHGSKTMTTGEGGMLITNRRDLYEQALFLADHGRTPGDTSFLNEAVAFKYKLSNIQAALGLAQLERLDELVHRKRQIQLWYEDHLKDTDLQVVRSRDEVTSSYWMTTAVDRTRTWLKHDLVSQLSERGVDCRPVFAPLSSLPAFQDQPAARMARERNTAAYDSTPYGLNLPSALNVTEDDVVVIAQAVRDVMSG